MPAKTGSRNGLSYGWSLGENNWNTGMDGNLTFIDRFGVHLSFKSFLNTPPGSPAAGDCHVVGSAPTGAWVGRAGQVAVYDDGAWRYGIPRTGWQAYCEADDGRYVFDGAWNLLAVGDISGLSGALDGKADLVGGVVPSSQLPSYVDDVIEVANFAALPATGEAGKIYVTLSDNNSWRWTGSTYQKVSQPLDEMPQAVAEAGTSETLYAATARRIRQAAAAWWLTVSTVFGRTLVNVADAAAGRTALGLGTVATQDASAVAVGTLSASGQIYSAANIAAAGEITCLTVRASQAVLITDWNAAVATGDFMAFEGANAPTPYGWYIGRATAHNTGYVTQEAWLFTTDNPVRFRRHSRGAVWSAWVHAGEWSSSGLAVAGSVTTKGATAIDVNAAFESNASASGLTAYHAQNNGGYGCFFGYDNLRYSGGAAMVRNIANTPIVFETNNTERARIDQSGNLGLGVTPAPHSPSGFGGPMLQVGGLAALIGSSVYCTLANNVYYNAGYYRYIANGAASSFEQSGGAHKWYTAPSGTAGQPITFTQAMTLDAAGVLAIAALPANDFPNDAAAAADGIPIGGLYHTSGTVKVRLS